jgi:3-phenylpropionate/trans-cinnamate dioxygenase ferredoxin reductase subunit
MHSIVVLGAGQAGGWVAKTLRDQNFAGKIVLVGDERHPPYERPPLSKEVLLGTRSHDSTYIWSAETLAELHIDVLLGRRAISIDRSAKTVALSTEEVLYYDRLVLATGCRVRKLDVPGADLPGINYLRGIDDAIKISNELKPGSRLLVVGGGWIGLEIAAAARQRSAKVIVVETARHLCARAVPPALGRLMQEYHEKRGVEFRLGTNVVRFGGDRNVEFGELSSGEIVEADLVVVGVGVVPNSELASVAEIETNNGIVVDRSGRSSDPSIYATGDVANQLGPSGKRLRLESWTNAQNQSIAVAKGLLGSASPYCEVPYFWSDQYNLRIQILGDVTDYERLVIRGDRGSDHTSFYLKGDKVVGVAAINSPQDIGIARRLIAREVAVDPKRLVDEGNLNELLKAPQTAALSA